MATTIFNLFAGSDLTLGSFVELHRRYNQLITATGAEKLRVTDQLTAYNGIIDQLAIRVNFAHGYEETPEVVRLDQGRDATQKFCYFTIMYASELPRESALYAAGNELRVVASPYKSIARHELTRQTSETAGFVRDLLAHPEALATLNLTIPVQELGQINTALATAMGMRELTLGDRNTLRGDVTTDELRKQLTNLLEEIARRINAAAIYLEDDATIAKLISDLNGVADHYRLIAGQKTAGSGSNSGSSQNNQGGSQSGQSGQGGQNTQTGDNTGNNGQQTGDNTGDNGNDNPGGNNNDNPGGDNGNDNPGGDINDGGLDD